MPPKRRVLPLECSDGTKPRYAMSWRGLSKRVMSPSSATNVAAATIAITTKRLQRPPHRWDRPVRKRRYDMNFQTVTPFRRRLDRRYTVLQHDMMHRLREL